MTTSIGRLPQNSSIETAKLSRAGKLGAKGLTRSRLLEIAALALIVGLAVGFRFIGLGSVGFNSDEAVYTGQAAAIVYDPDVRP